MLNSKSNMCFEVVSNQWTGFPSGVGCATGVHFYGLWCKFLIHKRFRFFKTVKCHASGLIISSKTLWSDHKTCLSWLQICKYLVLVFCICKKSSKICLKTGGHLRIFLFEPDFKWISTSWYWTKRNCTKRWNTWIHHNCRTFSNHP